MVTPPPTTPKCEPHTPHPRGYLDSADWYADMAVTHVQRKCKGCGLWLVWEPKPELPPRQPGLKEETG